MKDICWICDGWIEHTFQYSPNLSGNVNEIPLYIHLEFETESCFCLN